MRYGPILALVSLWCAATAAPAFAQRFPFERTFDVGGSPMLDVSTIRGKIDITAGAPGRIVVAGTVTVRVGVTVPANAMELARNLANDPPIVREGPTIRLRPPSDQIEQRAVTVSYQVQVPADTEIKTVSDSGATAVSGVSGAVGVRTQSGAIDLARLGSTATATTGSGAVTVNGVKGSLEVTTASSAFTGHMLGGNIRVRTMSGAVDAALSGSGDADVETASSAIRLRGVRGGLTAVTRSGRVSLDGLPARAWNVSTGSGAVDVVFERGSAVAGSAEPTDVSLMLDARTGSGSVKVTGAEIHGSTTKRRVEGTVGAGGPLVRIDTRSGSVAVQIGGT